MKNIYTVLILVATFHVYNCEEAVAPPDLAGEKKIFDLAADQEPKEIDFGASPLKKLDEDLTKELKNPVKLDVSFEVKLDVLSGLAEYEKNIRDLHAGVVSNSPSGVQLAKELLMQDGPTFLRTEVDQEHLKNLYNWDDGNVEHFNDLLKDIRSVYNNIVTDLKDKPTPYEILFSKKRNDALLQSQNTTCEETNAILQLDKALTIKLTNPSFADGVSLLSDLMSLHLLLNNVSQQFKANKERAWRIMDNLDDAGGLKLLKVAINGTRVQQVLKWPDNKVQDIKSSLMGISVMWRSLDKSSREPPARSNYPKDINFHLEPMP